MQCVWAHVSGGGLGSAWGGEGELGWVGLAGNIFFCINKNIACPVD